MRRTKRKTTSFKLRLIDNSNIDSFKKISVFKNNMAEDTINLWKTFIINEELNPIINFKEPIVIQALVENNVTPTTITTNGLNYQIENNKFVEQGSVSSTKFRITNNTENSIFVWIASNRSVLEVYTIPSNEYIDFQYKPTIYIHATENLEEDVQLQDVNTELSFFGVKTADIVIEKQSDVYQFTMQNVVYS